MGVTAKELFAENGILVVVGADGRIDDLVEKYIKGEMVSTDRFCQH